MYKGLLYGGKWKTFKSRAEYLQYMETNPEQVAAKAKVEAEIDRNRINKLMADLERKGLTNSGAYKHIKSNIAALTGNTKKSRITQKDLRRKKSAVSEVRGIYEDIKRREISVETARQETNKRKKTLENTLGLDKSLTQKQYENLFKVYSVLQDMYAGLGLDSGETLADISISLQKGKSVKSLLNFADSVAAEISAVPEIADYERQIIERGLQDFANGITPNVKNLIKNVVDINLQMQSEQVNKYNRLKGLYKGE